METQIELPDGKIVTLQHEGKLTDEAIKNAVSQLGYGKEESSLGRNLAGEGTRIAGALTGAIKGSKYGPVGSAIGGLLGAGIAEPLARAITPREETLGESVANVGLAAIQPVSKPATLVKRLVRGGLTGAGLGAAHTTIQTGIDEQRLPTLGELAPSVGIGALIGGGLEGGLGPRPSKTLPITAALDKRKPTSLAQANAEANEIATGKPTTQASSQATPAFIPQEKPLIVAADDEAGIEAAAESQARRVDLDDEDAIEAAASAQAKVASKRKAPVVFKGIQEGLPASKGRKAIPDFELWDLTEDIPGHPKGSTVSRDTLEKYGFEVPESPLKAAKAPVTTEPPKVEKVTPKAKESPPVPVSTPPPLKALAELGQEPEIRTRNLAKRVIESEVIPLETREVLKADPKILYERHKHRSFMDRAEASTDDDLKKLISEAANHDEGIIYRRELSNRLIRDKKFAEAASVFADQAQMLTPNAQALASARLIRTSIGDLHEVEEVVAKAGRNLTKEQKEKVLELSSKEIEAQKQVNILEKRAKEFFNKDNLEAYRKAQAAHAQAKASFEEYSAGIAPRDLPDMLVKMIQGNLLTPLSIASNVFGNMFWAPLERSSLAVSSAMDAVLTTGMKGMAKLMGKDASQVKRSISATNPLPSSMELAAMADGVRVASKELLTGPSTDSYIKAEVQRGFRPLRSLIDSVTGENLARDSKGNVKAWDRTKAFIEGTLGVPPEIMFRLLSIGDKPFRRASTVRAYLEQARLKGIKEDDLERFMALPDAKTKEIVEKATRRSIFAEENAGITTLNRFLDSDMAKLLRVDKIPALAGAMKIFGRLTVPFRQFPVNYALTALNFAAPHLALAKSAYYGFKSNSVQSVKGLSGKQIADAVLDNRRKSLQNLGEGAMGIMMYSAAEVLWNKGLISESPADTSAKRSDQAEAMGASKLNVDGLDRYLNGGDASYKKGDKLVDWTRAGIPAVIFHIYTSQQAKERDESGKLGDKAEKSSIFEHPLQNAISSVPGLGSFIFDQSFLAGTSSLLEAIKDADPESPKFQNWMGNMWKAITSIPVPNTVDAVARAKMEYVPEIRGRDAFETLGNIWRHKTFGLPAEDRPLVLKRDTWGKPIPRTPTGADPYVYGLIDVTKSGKQIENPHDQALYDLYKQTNRPSVYPDPVGRSLNFQGNNVELDPEDVEKMQEVIGQMRREGMEKFVDSRMWSKMEPFEKVLGLEKIYQGANEAGRKKFTTSSGIYQKYFSSDPDKKTTSRTTESILMRQ